MTKYPYRFVGTCGVAQNPQVSSAGLYPYPCATLGVASLRVSARLAGVGGGSRWQGWGHVLEDWLETVQVRQHGVGEGE